MQHPQKKRHDAGSYFVVIPKVLDLAAILETSEQCTAQPVQSLLGKSTELYWLGQIICKENKEHKEKRKYHVGTFHPNDRRGFVQGFTFELVLAQAA